MGSPKLKRYFVIIDLAEPWNFLPDDVKVDIEEGIGQGVIEEVMVFSSIDDVVSQLNLEQQRDEYAWMGSATRVEHESMRIARADLDMPNADESEVMSAIQRKIK